MTHDQYKNIIKLILALIFIYVIIAYFMKWWPFTNDVSGKRTSGPRCKCGTPNCSDSNCDPGQQRLSESSGSEREIPLEMPPSRR